MNIVEKAIEDLRKAAVSLEKVPWVEAPTLLNMPPTVTPARLRAKAEWLELQMKTAHTALEEI